MIGKLTGTFAGTTPEGAILIDVGGVGYLVRVSQGTLHEIRPDRSGVEVLSLLIHTAMREDAIDLYGFATEEELVFFKQLLSVSGIGPKSAIGILNVSDLTSLKSSIARGDASALTRVFGIGKKSAERVVVELRDKLSQELGEGGGVAGINAEVIEALMALGYRAEEARKACKTVLESGAAPGGVGEQVSAALKILGSRQTS